jgi:hypothetical protein
MGKPPTPNPSDPMNPMNDQITQLLIGEFLGRKKGGGPAPAPYLPPDTRKGGQYQPSAKMFMKK